jgi:LmbE family N-acetylglucosaminyl deacetylase
VFLTDGGMSHPASKSFPPERLIGLRETEARTAANLLGLTPDRLIFLREPDTNAPHAGEAFARVVDTIVAVADRYDCSGILAPWRFDPHCDHEAAALIATEVARRMNIRHVSYPVWGWILPDHQLVDADRPAGWRLDIALHLGRKLRAVAAHRSQYGDLIQDDPTGFRLPADLLSVFANHFETFLLP